MTDTGYRLVNIKGTLFMVKPAEFAKLSRMVTDGRITKGYASTIARKLLESGKVAAADVVQQYKRLKGL